jgi:phosphoadenosine phosphosulfate reductase
MLRVLRDRLAGDLAVVSSFGAESAVLLHLIAQIDPATRCCSRNAQAFPETVAYRDELVAHLGLTGLQIVEPDAEVLAKKDDNGLRWSWDPDGCCEIRKVQPLARRCCTSMPRSPAARASSPPRARGCPASRSIIPTRRAA